MTNKQIVKDCEELFQVFNGTGAELSCEIAEVTGNCSLSVSDFLETNGQKRLHQSCCDCWDKLVAISFASGFIMASMLDPESKASLKGLKELARTIKKAAILPIWEK